jgi:hypothetical protein
MATYTGFCFGTGETSTMKKKNIISQFSEACAGEKFVRKGPGVLGVEVVPNAQQSVDEVVGWLLQQTDDENTLNLTGFSRGAVTCIVIANQLNGLERKIDQERPLTSENDKLLKRLKKLEINIFAIDPVAGMHDKGKMDRRVIPNNVKDCVAVFQVDEMRRDFKPQDSTRIIIASPKTTRVSMLLMYGNHTDTTKTKRNMASGAAIIWHCFYQFLTQHGTIFNEGSMPRMVITDKRNLHLMSELPEEAEHYKKYKNSYILIEKDNTRALYYVKSDGMGYKEEDITDFNAFEAKIRAQRDKGKTKLSLEGTFYSDLAPFSSDPDKQQSKELLKLFAQHHQEREAYAKSGKKVKLADGLPVARAYRRLNKHLDFYVKNPDFFVNQLERELFKISYPRGFNYFFEKNQKDLGFPSNSEENNVIEELQQLKKEIPLLFSRLQEKHDIIGLDGAQLTIGDPAGVYCIEPCSTVRQMFPHLLTNSAKNLDPDRVKLEALEHEVYRLTFQYDREKSPFLVFTARSQAAKTRALRNAVRDIIENKPGSVQQKYEQILDEVEYYYKHLVQVTSTSQLRSMLGKVLAQHHRFYSVTNTSVPRIVIAELIYATLSLLKETVAFVFNLGHIGGGILSALGLALQNFGRRCNDAIGKVGSNPLKALASAIAYAFEGIGFAIKNSFGLKPLGHLITSAMSNIRDEAVKAIGPVEMDNCRPMKVGPYQSS